MHANPWLRRFTKITCCSTLFLIFAGGMVTSTGSGLAVPDWPLSYGTFFPPMVGGIFYEHGHRMVATVVGFLTLCQAIWLWRAEDRRWVKVLGFVALGAVIAQGILGGITVLFFLPTPVSVGHGVLAQTFFVLTVIIAYSQSTEREVDVNKGRSNVHGNFLRLLLVFIVLIYTQLILGAVMRHSGAGLAIPDFPKMGGYWIPPFNQKMLSTINAWQFDHNFDMVDLRQVGLHFAHRLGALFIFFAVILLDITALRYYAYNSKVLSALYLLNALIVIQILLGIASVLTLKNPVTVSLHVVNGAAILGASVLLFLRAAPLSMQRLKSIL